MWAIGVVGGLIALAIFILWVPLDIVLNVNIHGKPEVRLRFSWFFGLVSRDMPGAREKPVAKKKTEKAKEKRRWRDIRTIFKLLRTKGLLRNFIKLVKGIFSCFRFRDMVTDFRIGLGDPANTGLLFAVLGPACVVIGSSRFSRINIQPAFDDSVVLDGYSHGTARLHPIRLVPPLLKFTFSTPTARVAWRLLAEKWKRKK